MLNNFAKLVFSELKIKLSQDQLDQFQQFYDFLLQYNQHTNLTRVKSQDIPLLHFYDSLTSVKFVDYTKVKSLLDIGTGAGFPGVPLKIVFPHLKITLVESKNKKITFLNELIQILSINKCGALHIRAEDLSRVPGHKNSYDIVTARAVTSLSELIKISKPFLNKKGRMIFYKGPKAEEELKEAEKQIKKFKLNSEKHSFKLPVEEHNRVIFIMKAV